MDCADMINVIVTMTFFYMLCDIIYLILILYMTECHLLLLLIIFRIMLFISAHPILLLSASSLAIRGNSTPAIVSLTPWLGRSLSLRRYGIGRCEAGYGRFDGASRGESGDRMCEARRPLRRHEYTLYKDWCMSLYIHIVMYI